MTPLLPACCFWCHRAWSLLCHLPSPGTFQMPYFWSSYRVYLNIGKKWKVYVNCKRKVFHFSQKHIGRCEYFHFLLLLSPKAKFSNKTKQNKILVFILLHFLYCIWCLFRSLIFWQELCQSLKSFGIEQNSISHFSMVMHCVQQYNWAEQCVERHEMTCPTFLRQKVLNRTLKDFIPS